MTRPALRLVALLAAPWLLSACNVVMTKAPLFSAADAAGAPALRPGVWVFFKEPDCKFDDHAPFTDWPDCAGGGLVGASDIAGHKGGSPKDMLEHSPLILAAGDPRVAQLQVTVDTSVQASAEASGGASASASSSVSAPESKPFAYAGIRPTKFDDQGRITAFTSWPVQCGPPPPVDEKGNATAMGTLKPLPGMEMKPGDAVCTTRSKDALRAAAKASEAWADQPRESNWLRDGER
jgi:hypothetical protein